MKKKQISSEQKSEVRAAPLSLIELTGNDGQAAIAEPAELPEPAAIPEPAELPEPAAIPAPAELPEPAAIPEPAELPEPAVISEPPVIPAPAEMKDVQSTYTSNDPSEDDYVDPKASSSDFRVKKSRTRTVYEPRQKRRRLLKPAYIVIALVIVCIAAVGLFLATIVNPKEQIPSPMTLNGDSISNAQFNFVYHYVLIENAINIFDLNTEEVLNSPSEDGFATYREYFLDMAAREIQITTLLYDDARSKGYEINDSQKQRAQAYIDWLSRKADEIKVDVNTYIKGYFGPNVTPDLILEVLAKKYFTDDYKNGPKLEELKATAEQAEDAYLANPNQYDTISYRVLHIVFEQTADSFKATAHLRAEEIIDGIGHDESKFESVAAKFFTGEAKKNILKKNSTRVSNVRFANVEDANWKSWLFDAGRKPGDCTIFDDADGFPILVCFSSRTRQIEPLRDVRFLYINREDGAAGKPGIPDSEILPVAKSILDSITDGASMQSFENTYADNISSGKMKTAHINDTYKGILTSSLDAWIFDKARVQGDKTLIETDTQIIILYYVGASPDPEWFDRVNSVIRMNNFQAFLLEKELDYTFELNEDGLQYIKDVPSKGRLQLCLMYT